MSKPTKDQLSVLQGKIDKGRAAERVLNDTAAMDYFDYLRSRLLDMLLQKAVNDPGVSDLHAMAKAVDKVRQFMRNDIADGKQAAEQLRMMQDGNRR